MTTQQGTVLGARYELVERIASGGMGDLWRAVDDVLGRDVAVKILKRELSSQPGFLERFRREARQTAMLSHPGIATVYDYGEDDGTPYIVMELVAGEPLSALLARSGRLPTPVAASLLTQAADALAVAHRAGIVHRDVTPGNLLVSADGRLKVTDFGIARMVEASPLTATGSVLGTAQYLSPEQASGRTTTPASDVYSLGVVAYEMVAGRRPFLADSHVGLAMAHLNEPPPPLPDDVPAALRTAILHALKKDPATRPADGAAFAAELRALGPLGRSTLDTRTRAVPATVPIEVAAGAFTPPGATMPMPGLDLPEPHGPARDAPPSAPNRDGRRRHPALMIAAAAAVVVVLVLLLVTRDPADDALDATATTTASSATTLSQTTVPAAGATASTAAPSSATSAPPAADVVIDEASYVGRNKDAVIDELESLGFTVVEEKVGRPAGMRNNEVVGIEPNGAVEARSAVTVLVAGGKKDK